MSRRKKLEICLAAILVMMASLIGYKVYLLFHEADYQAINADHLYTIGNTLSGKEAFSFAVVGNIRNSMRLFERRIAPLIREAGADFMISAGNAVADGAEDKYRLLYRGLKELKLPYLLTAGRNETEDFGSGRFYRHFGPYFFSFHLENTAFIFLDSTGQTSWKWQLQWLREELDRAALLRYRFVFIGHSLSPLPGFAQDDKRYVIEEDVALQLRQLFTDFRVSAVFSAGYPSFHETVVQGVRYIVSGGGGGLFLNERQHYQFVRVGVTPDGVVCENVTVPHQPGIIRDKVETLKLFLHSFFYMSLFNFLLILGLIGLAALKIYSLIIRQEGLYRNFSIEETALAGKVLHVVMFTNNYLPFVGGVPFSIDRLFRGLVRRGHEVRIVAPAFREPWTDPEDGSIIRCPPLWHTGDDNFPIANAFAPDIHQQVRSAPCDLIHVHHPFWLGRKGMRIAKELGVPVVFTYHTRLERCTHYIPLRGTMLKNLLAHLIIKQFANQCDAIITPTSSTEEYLRNLGVSALIETIPTGVDLDGYRKWQPEAIQELRANYADDGELLLLSVSRMAREKNLDFLIEGLAEVNRRSRVAFKCLLVGDGSETKRLKEKVEACGLGKRIIFTGNLPAEVVIGCYLAADLFVFASTSETQGMVILEAMAGGCPVVAVRASGVFDLVRDGFNGFKVAERREAWADAVIRLMEDGELRAVLSGNSRAFAADYGVDLVADQVARLYRRVIAMHHSE